MKNRSFRRWAGIFILSILSICVIAALVSFITNSSIPAKSANIETLADVQKALLREATLLRKSLGNAVFPGFGDQEIPFVVYNEQYAFYVGDEQPSPGWEMTPYGETRGGVWELVPADDFYGSPYYRTPITDPNETPESFIVRVNDQLAGSFQTREYGLISLAATMKSELPPVIRSIVPYRLVAGQLFTRPDAYIAGLLHETFHAYQGTVNPEKFSQSELVANQESDYPFEEEDVKAVWKEELKILSQAAQIETSSQARDLAVQFLAVREQRRRLPAINENHIVYEQKREWLEGLAKYAELEIGRLAAVDNYSPHPEVIEAADLEDYSARERFWRIQLDSIDNTLYNGETLFYYTGFAQAVLLDYLMPDWKERAIMDGAVLDELLQQAVNAP